MSIRARADSRQQYLYTRELPESKYPARKLVVSLCSLLKHGAAGRPLGNLQRSIRSPLILPVHPVSIRARADSRQQYLYTSELPESKYPARRLVVSLCSLLNTGRPAPTQVKRKKINKINKNKTLTGPRKTKFETHVHLPTRNDRVWSIWRKSKFYAFGRHF